jgi:uncharacterized membrane protein YkvI
MAGSTHSSSWQRLWLPGFAFMSVVVGGGYATGREIVEFFMTAGPMAGLAGLAVTAACWSLVAASSFDLAREADAFDYRSFFRRLLGRGWILFDLCYLAILLLVLCVVGAAAGEIAANLLGLPPLAGAVALLGLVTIASYLGTAAIERFFSLWGVLMVVTYATLLGAALWLFHDPVTVTLASGAAGSRWWLAGGLQYAGYNLAVVPAILYCARHQRSRHDSWVAGLLCGPIAILPGLCLYLALLAVYPAALAAPVPLQVLLQHLGAPWLAALMQIVIFGTLAQTGVGVLQGFIERLMPVSTLAPRRAAAIRATITFAIAAFAILGAERIGIIALVARGYGTVSWLVIATFAVPLLVNRALRVRRRSRAGGRTP